MKSNLKKEGDPFLHGDQSPNPWDLPRSGQHDVQAGGAAAQPCQPLSRRSGRFPALPYPPLRQGQSTLPAPTIQSHLKKSLQERRWHAITTLVLGQIRWPVLG
jgi:hypothetical protein